MYESSETIRNAQGVCMMLRLPLLLALIAVALIGCAPKSGIRVDTATEWDKEQSPGLGNTQDTCNCIEARF